MPVYLPPHIGYHVPLSADLCKTRVWVGRNVRRDAIKTVGGLAKANTIGEDEEEALEKAIQDLTDDYVKQVNSNPSEFQSKEVKTRNARGSVTLQLVTLQYSTDFKVRGVHWK
jgi:ribosome recycling factor